jgi:hypothetical protein
MTALTHLFQTTVADASAAAVLYTTTITVTAVTAVAAPTSERRRDARETLKVLLGRRLNH